MKNVVVVLLFIFISGCGSKEPFLHTEVFSDACIKPLHDYHYETCNSIIFMINSRLFEIPAEFETDLASIPKTAWPILSPSHSSLIKASIIHDYFYRKTCDFTRQQADLIFYHILRNEGISSIKASILYYAVRWFGWNSYNEDYCESKNMNYSEQVADLYKKTDYLRGHYYGRSSMDKKT